MKLFNFFSIFYYILSLTSQPILKLGHNHRQNVIEISFQHCKHAQMFMTSNVQNLFLQTEVVEKYNSSKM